MISVGSQSLDDQWWIVVTVDGKQLPIIPVQGRNEAKRLEPFIQTVADKIAIEIERKTMRVVRNRIEQAMK
jgi:hypothetical protein